MINYIFHIGERCQHYQFLSNNNLLTAYNMFTGISVSFPSVVKLLKNGCNDLKNNIAKFTISNKHIEGVTFINCNNYTNEELNYYGKLIIENKFNFFGSKNFYYTQPYCINIKYTDMNNLLEHDIYNWNDEVCIMPNSNYADAVFLDKVNRRIDRFIDTINNNLENTLLFYMNKSVLDINCEDKIKYICSIYDLPYKLFYVIPVYSEDNNTNPLVEEGIRVINNINFCIVYFPSNNFQLINNPNDDNALIFTNEYNKIKSMLINSYDIELINLFE